MSSAEITWQSSESKLPPSREERLQMYMDSFPEEQRARLGLPEDYEIDENGRHSLTFKEFCSHQLDMMESEGFDIEDYSMVNDAGVLRRFHYPPERPASGRSLAELSTCSRLAIRKFNDAKKTKFRLVNVVKANSEALCPYRYYITFEATDKKSGSQIFQARVNIVFPSRKKVELVRIKTAPKLYKPRRELWDV